MTAPSAIWIPDLDLSQAVALAVPADSP